MSAHANRLSPRRRRILYNDDGDTRFHASTIEKVLDLRFNKVANTDIDVYLLNVWSCFGRKAIQDMGLPQANQATIDAARRHEKEIWMSFRMNDSHDAHWPPETFNDTTEKPRLLRPHSLKQTNPETMVGEQWMCNNIEVVPTASIMHMTWSAFDYSNPLVRQYISEAIIEHAREYDWDGVELDFIRHPIFFKLGEIEENIPTMTGFVAHIRAALDEIGTRRGRPYPLAVHVPDSPKYCLRCGIDINYWLAHDLIDLVVMGTAYTPHGVLYQEFANLCRYYGVPAHVCLNAGAARTTYKYGCNNGGKPPVLELFYGRASSIWSENVDGIETFNLWASTEDTTDGCPMVSHLNDICDPQRLIGKNKIYEAATYAAWLDREILSDPAIRPRVVDQVPMLIKIGDPVERLTCEGRIKQIYIRIRVSNLVQGESIQIMINGYSAILTNRYKEIDESGLQYGPYRYPGGGWWFEGVVNSPPIRQGVNYITVRPGLGSLGQAESRVENIQINIDY